MAEAAPNRVSDRAASAGAGAGTAAGAGRGTILIVEDDTAMRTMLREALEAR